MGCGASNLKYEHDDARTTQPDDVHVVQVVHPTAVMHGPWLGGEEIRCQAYQHKDGYLVFACVHTPYLKMIRAHLGIAKATSKVPEVITHDAVSNAWDEAEIPVPAGFYLLKNVQGLASIPDGPSNIPNSKLCFREEGTGQISATGREFIQWVHDAGIPGGQLAVVHNGQLLLNIATGLQNRESQSPMEVTDRFFTNCTSCSIIHMMLMHMVDNGIVSLEDNPFEKLYGEGFLDSFGSSLDPKWREVTFSKWGFGGVGNPDAGLIPKNGKADDMVRYLVDEGTKELPGIADLRNHPGSTGFYGEGGDLLNRVMMKLAGDQPFEASTYSCGPAYAKYMRDKLYAPAMAPFGDVVPFWNVEEGWRTVRVYDGTKNMEWSPDPWSSIPGAIGCEPWVLPMSCLAALAGGMQNFLSQSAVDRMFSKEHKWQFDHPGASPLNLGWQCDIHTMGIAAKGGGDSDRCATIVGHTKSGAGIAAAISGQPSGTGVESQKLWQFVHDLKRLLE